MGSFWRGRQVLVTGAGGFIGSHLSERLANEGAKVKALLHYNSAGSRGWLAQSSFQEQIQFFNGDICDRDSAVQAAEGCEYIFHLAALIAIPYSYQAPESYVRTNINGTMNLLQAARLTGAVRILHTSTSEVYGTARQVPIKEDHPLQGQSPYAASKIGADKIAESFLLSFGTPVVTVRPFNTFGPRQSARAVIPTIISQLLKGPRVKLGSISPTRDLNYVSNTVDGYLRAAESVEALGATINFGSGREISIGDLANLISHLMKVEIEVECEETRLRPEGSEVQRLLASNELAKALTGWEPQVSLENGLLSTIDWIKQNQAHFRPEAFAV